MKMEIKAYGKGKSRVMLCKTQSGFTVESGNRVMLIDDMERALKEFNEVVRYKERKSTNINKV